MQSSAIILSFIAAVSATTCTMVAGPHRAPVKASPAYDTSSLSAVPQSDACKDLDQPLSEPEQMACATSAIAAIDEQLAFLVASRLQFAAVFKVAAIVREMPGVGVPAAALGPKVAYYGGAQGAGQSIGEALSAATSAAEADAVKRMCK